MPRDNQGETVLIQIVALYRNAERAHYNRKSPRQDSASLSQA
jgi:hypothetical protein